MAIIVNPVWILTRHFWSRDQTQIYQIDELKNNMRYLFPRIVNELKQQDFKNLPLQFSQLSAVNVPPLENTTLLMRLYLKKLHHINVLFTSPFDVRSLVEHARIMQILDKKLAYDRKLITKMDIMELRLHLYLRKLNYESMDIDQMRLLLNRWLDHAQSFDTAVYIFSPVLLQARRNHFFMGKTFAEEFTDKITKGMAVSNQSVIKVLRTWKEELSKKFGNK